MVRTINRECTIYKGSAQQLNGIFIAWVKQKEDTTALGLIVTLNGKTILMEHTKFVFDEPVETGQFTLALCYLNPSKTTSESNLTDCLFHMWLRDNTKGKIRSKALVEDSHGAVHEVNLKNIQLLLEQY